MPRRVRRKTLGIATATATVALAFIPTASAGAATKTVRTAVGDSPAGIQAAVDAFRADLGNPNNGATPGSEPSGRREINWDGVPDTFAAPNFLPLDFFNTTSPRGAVFSTPEAGVQVSANQGVAPVEFDNLDPRSSRQFRTFSPQRLFTAVGSNVVDVRFRVPGSTTRATTSGFGSVFTDVDRHRTTWIAYYDQRNRRLAIHAAPARRSRETLSFLGVSFRGRRVARVRIWSGNVAIGHVERGRRDVVAMDDFLYGEPR